MCYRYGGSQGPQGPGCRIQQPLARRSEAPAVHFCHRGLCPSTCEQARLAPSHIVQHAHVCVLHLLKPRYGCVPVSYELDRCPGWTRLRPAQHGQYTSSIAFDARLRSAHIGCYQSRTGSGVQLRLRAIEFVAPTTGVVMGHAHKQSDCNLCYSVFLSLPKDTDSTKLSHEAGADTLQRQYTHDALCTQQDSTSMDVQAVHRNENRHLMPTITQPLNTFTAVLLVGRSYTAVRGIMM